MITRQGVHIWGEASFLSDADVEAIISETKRQKDIDTDITDINVKTPDEVEVITGRGNHGNSITIKKEKARWKRIGEAETWIVQRRSNPYVRCQGLRARV